MLRSRVLRRKYGLVVAEASRTDALGDDGGGVALSLVQILCNTFLGSLQVGEVLRAERKGLVREAVRPVVRLQPGIDFIQLVQHVGGPVH